MSNEMRKKLTETQMKLLSETQMAIAQARAIMQKAEVDAQRVIQLIFDAHDVPQHYIADVDQQTGELVCREPQQGQMGSAPQLVS